MLERVALSLKVLCEQVSERFLSGHCNEGVLFRGELGLEKLLQRSRIRLSEDIGSALGMQLVDFHSQLCEGTDVVGLCASWIDLAVLVPSLVACGVDPDPILATHPATRDVESVAVEAFLCGVLGYWERALRRPAPSRAPYLYQYRVEAARATRGWLRRRVH